ncbi:MAG TPA: hypothetical protein VFZ85_12140 [Jiangellaceae bacterium]
MIVERWRGSPAEFHARALPRSLTEMTAWVFAPERPALVLGSGQRDEVADLQRAQARGIEVVRRRSGGGAVLLIPGDCLWIDVLLPRNDRRWVDDVGLSADWLGDTWCRSLAKLGVAGALHRGRLERTGWGPLVCFAALGPGEVTVDGRKVVGISQRRTRDVARFQCLVHRVWDPQLLLDLLRLSADDRIRGRAELRDAAAGPGIPLDNLEAALIAELDSGSRKPVTDGAVPPARPA